MKNNVLQNVENYNKILDESIQEVYNKYIGVLNEYIIHHLDTLQSKNSGTLSMEKMKKCLLIGIQCVSHVFKMILFYTKNLHITVYHSQRAFYFYVEFMEQMMEDMHTFLQLTPKDACLFVYKKTIYEINNEYRSSYNIKETQDEKIINEILQLYYRLLCSIIETNNDPINIIKSLHNNIFKIVQALNKLQHKIDNKDILEEKMKELNSYIYNLSDLNYKQIEKMIKNMKK